MGQDQEHLGFIGSGKKFVFYPESNRNALEGFEMGNDMMFFKDLSGCYTEKRLGWRQSWGGGGGNGILGRLLQ